MTPAPSTTGMTSHFHRTMPMNATAAITTANRSTVLPGKEDMEAEPDGEIQDYADDCGGDSGERGGEFLVAAELLNVRRAEENPEEARDECVQVVMNAPSVAASSGGSAPG